MDAKKPPAKVPAKKVTSDHLESLEDGKFRDPVVVGTGKKKKVTPSETG